MTTGQDRQRRHSCSDEGVVHVSVWHVIPCGRPEPGSGSRFRFWVVSWDRICRHPGLHMGQLAGKELVHIFSQAMPQAGVLHSLLGPLRQCGTSCMSQPNTWESGPYLSGLNAAFDSGKSRQGSATQN